MISAHDTFHELQCWEIPEYLLFDAEESFPALLENLTGFFGRQPELPEWIYDGIMLGIQGGTQTVWDKLESGEIGRRIGIQRLVSGLGRY